jgi:hypothetical protein
MEDLIAAFPNEFFPRHRLVLNGRQGSFREVGRYDLLFTDEFGTQILMELKAVPAKYEHATQLAKYKDALRERNATNTLMWLVAPSIPRSVRDFLDQVGIEYTEIHEAEFRKVADCHAYYLGSEDVISINSASSSRKSAQPVEFRTMTVQESRAVESWFFNTDEGEPEGKGAYVKMLENSCIALWNFKGKGDPEQILSKPTAGERVFYYLNRVGFIATGIFTNEPPFPDDTVFPHGTPGAISRRVSNLVSVAHSHALSPSEVKSIGGRLQYIRALYKIVDTQVADKIYEELESRALRRQN